MTTEQTNYLDEYLFEASTKDTPSISIMYLIASTIYKSMFDSASPKSFAQCWINWLDTLEIER